MIPIHKVRLRAHDSRGRRILQHLERVRELARGETEDPHISRWCAKGELLVTKMAEVVHGERDPWSIDHHELRSWLADGRLLERDHAARRA